MKTLIFIIWAIAVFMGMSKLSASNNGEPTPLTTTKEYTILSQNDLGASAH